jgi:hypothetical protein
MPKRKACHSSALKFCKAGIEDTQIVEKRTDETIGCIALLLARIFAGLYRIWAAYQNTQLQDDRGGVVGAVHRVELRFAGFGSFHIS